VSCAPTTPVPFTNIEKGDLLWSDEFNYDGPPDSNKWYLQSNTVNNYYKISNAWTDNNAYVSGGNLTLEAKKESYTGKNYTSAAIISKRGFQYGIFEMRAKLGTGRGTWSNFWLFSDDRKSTKWPADGEVDIVEVVDSTNYTHNRVHGTIHNDKFDNFR
jgi:beta-glucanase (GH16 family)